MSSSNPHRVAGPLDEPYTEPASTKHWFFRGLDRWGAFEREYQGAATLIVVLGAPCVLLVVVTAAVLAVKAANPDACVERAAVAEIKCEKGQTLVREEGAFFCRCPQ